MKKTALMLSYAAFPLAYAGEAAAKTAGTGNSTAATAPAKPKVDRVAPVLTGATNAVAMPEVRARGSKSTYPFETLTERGFSFGVKNKTAAQMASIVSNANKKGVQGKKDAAGNTVFKQEEVKDATGAVVGFKNGEAETEVVKHFFAVDCDPAKDPEGASVRVFRDK